MLGYDVVFTCVQPFICIQDVPQARFTAQCSVQYCKRQVGLFSAGIFYVWLYTFFFKDTVVAVHKVLESVCNP